MAMIYHAVKRAIDLVAAGLGLIVLSPLLAFLALAIRLSSPGPAVFRQNRVGKNGKVFTFYKFRSMRTDADPYGFSPKDDRDPRVTPVGRFLRRYSLDELPQLLNVFFGQMTLIGPRPLLQWQYEQWTDHQKRRCEVKPGLTGWAQVNGRGALTHEDKIDMDIWYVDHEGPWLDVKILFQTLFRVARGDDTLEVEYSRRSQESRESAQTASKG